MNYSFMISWKVYVSISNKDISSMSDVLSFWNTYLAEKHVCILSQKCSPKLSAKIGNSDQVGRRWRGTKDVKELKIRAEGIPQQHKLLSG